MLFKNNLTPAYAYAGYQEPQNKVNNQKENITLMAAKNDDLKNYSSQKGAAKKKPQAQPQGKNTQKKGGKAPKSSRKFLPFIFAIIAIVAIIVIIAIVVAIINAPGSNMKKDDTVFFAYKDPDNRYHVIVNDEEKDDIVFENEIELCTAANNTFAYIFEKVPSGGIKIHILKANADKVDSSKRTEVTPASKIEGYSTLAPCVVYKVKSSDTAEDSSYCFKGNGTDDKLAEVAASNFVIANDGSCVYYTTGSASTTLYKYSSVPDNLEKTNFIPKATSADGRYLYGTHATANSLYYIDTTKPNDNNELIAKKIELPSGIFYGITDMNADGDQIIFATRTTNGSKITSHFYEIGDEKAITLADGIFKSVHPDPEVIFEDSLLDSFFTVTDVSVSTNDDDDETATATKVSTYFLSKKKEAVKIVDTYGKFSPNGKHFYYIDDANQLKRVALSSRKFDKHETVSTTGVKDFVITQKGDIYAFFKESATPDGKLSIYFYDSSDPSAIHLTSNADANSIYLSVNTLYFAITKEDSQGQTTTKVYSTTDGSEPSVADFDKINLTMSPTFVMGAGKKGYAYVTNESTKETKLFYTSSGKKFESLFSCYLFDAKVTN